MGFTLFIHFLWKKEKNDNIKVETKRKKEQK